MRPGERIGDYAIVSKIGEGGMSIVYLAERTSNRTRVVVKELKEQHRFNPQLIDRFLREATILQSLRHPHLARVFDVLQHDGKHYIIQEHLSGGSLADLLREKKPYSEQEAIRWCCDALRAMNYAHENGIVHRDLKPNNLMLDDQRKIRVIDFGIARAFGQERLTRTSDGSIGTLEYMSPEQILTPNQIDHLTDVYSMGIVLYELLSGSVPFEGPTPFSVQEKIARQPPPPLTQLGRGVVPLHPNGGGINPKLARIVFQAIEKRPERRFGGCAEFALQLERHLSQWTGSSRAEAVTRSPFILVGLGLAIVIVAIVGWHLYSPADTPRESQSVATLENQSRDEAERRRVEDERQRAEAERQQAELRRAEADRQAQIQEAERQAQLQKQQEAEQQAQFQKQQEAEQQAQFQKQQEAERQAQLQKQQEAERQAQIQKQQEAERQAQIQKQQEAERQAQFQKQQEAERQAQIQKQQEAERQAQIQKQQEAGRQAQLQRQQESDRLRQQQAAAAFFASVMGTWTREEDSNFDQSRTRTREVLNIGNNCSGMLSRTVTTYERGFAGWKEVNSQTSQFTFRCDPAGRISGELNTQLSVQDRALLLGTSTFTRRR